MVPSFDPFQTARKVADEAATLVAGARDQTAARVGGVRDLIVGKIVDIKESALAGVKDLVDDLNHHLPALQEAGYTLTEVAVEVGLGPKVVATFTTRPDISEERVDAVIAEHKDATVTVALLRALFAAYKLQNGLHIAGMKPRGIAVEIGIPPAVVVKFA